MAGEQFMVRLAGRDFSLQFIAEKEKRDLGSSLLQSQVMIQSLKKWEDPENTHEI